MGRQYRLISRFGGHPHRTLNLIGNAAVFSGRIVLFLSLKSLPYEPEVSRTPIDTPLYESQTPINRFAYLSFIGIP